MIFPPPRVGAAPRGVAAPRAIAAVALPGPSGGDGDNPEALDALDARIAALVAKATSPDDEALESQREAFDIILKERAELEREGVALRDLAMEQIKQDDELLKKWIALI